MSSELVPQPTAGRPVKAGYLAAILDADGMRISEWTPLTAKFDELCLFAEWNEGDVIGRAYAWVVLDPVTDGVTGGMLDCPITVQRGNYPIELRIFADVVYDSPLIHPDVRTSPRTFPGTQRELT